MHNSLCSLVNFEFEYVHRVPVLGQKTPLPTPLSLPPVLHPTSTDDYQSAPPLVYERGTTEPHSLVGARVAVRWGGGVFYPGVIGQFDANNGKHEINYDDGEKRYVVYVVE